MWRGKSLPALLQKIKTRQQSVKVKMSPCGTGAAGSGREELRRAEAEAERKRREAERCEPLLTAANRYAGAGEGVTEMWVYNVWAMYCADKYVLCTGDTGENTVEDIEGHIAYLEGIIKQGTPGEMGVYMPDCSRSGTETFID